MATIETIVNQRPVDLAPIDPNVSVPKSVRDAAAAAEAFYKAPVDPNAPPPASQVENPPAATTPSTVDPATNPDGQPNVPPASPVLGQQQEQPPQPVVLQPAEPVHEEPRRADGSIDWEHRYNSMKGRYDAAQRTIGSMQEQMTQLGDELVRTQALLTQAPPQPATGQNPPPSTPNKKYITPQDEENYGTDLIDLARRAALDTVEPELNQLRNENNQLRNRVITTSQKDVHDLLTQKIPNWREINRSPQFKRWLSLRDVYSGGVRQQMLNVAFQAADAPRVLAFFTGFLNEAQATGQLAPAPQPAQVDPPRQAAVPLESLAAPGRARPASGDTSPASSAEKPVFTRAQIARFYSDVRRGAYAGNEVEKSRLEQQIFAAQSEGRVRG